MIASYQNPREHAFLALWKALKEGVFISDTLQSAGLEKRELQLAQQIAFGSCQRLLSLDYLIAALSEKKTTARLKERCLLYTAIYQLYFLERLPPYAVVNESVALAKKYFHKSFAGYANALLRKLIQKPPVLPRGNSIAELSVRHSYPEFFVSILMDKYGYEKTISVLEAGNTAAKVMARVRDLSTEVSPEILFCTEPCRMIIVEDPSQVINSANFYIQNATQAILFNRLCQGINSPKKILDLCAAPGGKLVAASDHFPKASLWANDSSPERLTTLKDNCRKYSISPTFSCLPGEQFTSDEKFDLIIVDAPCSNSGVLNKRPEARWRLNPDNLRQLQKEQMMLLENAVSLLAPEGQIWYLTCSILPQENEDFIGEISNRLNLTVKNQYTILPSIVGYDGGYACALSKKV